MNNQERIIKKYANRRLYDTKKSSYITLEDVRQLIIDGINITVLDAKTKEDITRSVLLQIIAEHEQTGQPMFSTHFLSQLIRLYDDEVQGLMGSFLEKSFATFMEQQQQFKQQLDSNLKNSFWENMQQLNEQQLEAWQQFQKNPMDFFSAFTQQKDKNNNDEK